MTFIEGLRDRLYLSIVGLAILFLGFAWYMSQLAFGDMGKILLDVGQSGILITGIVTIVFFITASLYREREHMLHALIIRCSRGNYLLGKWLGFAALIAIFVTLNGVVLALVSIHYGKLGWPLIQSLIYIFFELNLIAAFSLLFSTVVGSQALNGLLTFGIYVSGHGLNEALRIADLKGSAWQQFSSTLMGWFLPDLERLNIRLLASYQQAVPMEELFLTLTYASTWIAVVLVITVLIFNRQAL